MPDADLHSLLARAGRRGHRRMAAAVLHGESRTSAAWRRDGGGAEPGEVYEVGSITKGLTGILLAEMTGSGEVALEDPLSRHLAADWLPAWPEREPTLEELATHRAGLPNAPRGMFAKEVGMLVGLRRSDPWAELELGGYREAVSRTRPRGRPGGKPRYSSLGFGLLGEALAARAGASYEELISERVLGPLGLEASYAPGPAVADAELPAGRTRRGRAAPPLRDLMPAAGAVRSSALDVLRLLEAFDRPGPLSEAMMLSREPRVEAGRGISIGLGWVVESRGGGPTVVWHNGMTWGFAAWAGFAPGRGAAAVVLSDTARRVDRLGFLLVAEALKGASD